MNRLPEASGAKSREQTLESRKKLPKSIQIEIFVVPLGVAGFSAQVKQHLTWAEFPPVMLALNSDRGRSQGAFQLLNCSMLMAFLTKPFHKMDSVLID
jgi:hypothetical protein